MAADGGAAVGFQRLAAELPAGMEAAWLCVDAEGREEACEGSAVWGGGHRLGWVEVGAGGCLLKAPFWCD